MAYGKSPEAEEEFEFNLMGDDIIKAKEKAFALCLKLSETSPLKFKEYSALLKKLLGSVGNGIFIEPPFNCSNGKNIHVGSDFLVSSNVTISDVYRGLLRYRPQYPHYHRVPPAVSGPAPGACGHGDFH